MGNILFFEINPVKKFISVTYEVNLNTWMFSHAR